jgi:hypothetical protein
MRVINRFRRNGIGDKKNILEQKLWLRIERQKMSRERDQKFVPKHDPNIDPNPRYIFISCT